MRRSITLFVILVVFAKILSAQVTIDGYAYLENQTDHSGIQVLFERTTPSTLFDSVNNDVNGYFSIQLEIGVYDVTYSKEDYFNRYLYEQSLFSNSTLPDVTLLERTTLINVPSDFPKIQSAINEAISGDTVFVAQGTYVENINFLGKSITVGSLFLTTGDTTYISQTIIDGNQNRSVVTFSSGEDSNSVLIGFTITNGSAEDGGGVYCENSNPSLQNLSISGNSQTGTGSLNGGGGIYCNYSSPSLVNVALISNSASSGGGGIYCYNSNPSLLELTISENTAYSGGGIYCYSSSPNLENVTIFSNSATVHGGGIYCKYYSNPSLVNVAITGNSTTGSSGRGGGIYCESNSSPILLDVTIISNTVTNVGGGIYCKEYSSPYLTNVIISANSAIGNNGVAGGIFLSSSNSILTDVTISGNTASANGGGIYLTSSNPSISNVTIVGNTASANGGGIYLASSNPSILNVTISGNAASSDGAGVYITDSNPSIVNCIVSHNTGNYGVYAGSGTPSFTYSDFSDNEGGNFYNVGDWIGVNVTVNANGDSCDLYYNIQLDPQFVNSDSGDYQLLYSSPCIDAGDPALPLDPDGTLSDMGAYYYDQSIIPTITSVPDTIAIEDSLYSYQLSAVGIPSPTFSLLVYPEGMTIDTTGLICWLPNNDDVGDTIVSCTATNDMGSDTQTFNLHINNMNDPPSIITTSLDDAIEDQAYNFTIQATDDDIVHGDNITFSLSVSPVGMIINNTTGEINWLPDNEDVGDTTVTVLVTDDSSSTDTKTYTLIVINVNDPPILSAIPDTSFNEDELLIFAISYLYDFVYDPDNADSTLTLSFSDTNYIHFALDEDSVTLSAEKDWFGKDTLLVIVNDGEFTDTASFVITVHPMNDAPYFTELMPDSISFNSNVSDTLLLTELASDIDNPDSTLI